MILELFAIRHKPSGFFLPEVNKGYTYSEPDEHRIPRLFETQGGAKRALAWWLKGVTSVHRSTSPDTWMGPGEYDEVWNTTAEEHRKAEDMEVVPVLLKT